MFSFSVILHNSHVDTGSSGKVLSLATKCDKLPSTAVITTRSVQQHQLHSPPVRLTSMPYIFMCGETQCCEVWLLSVVQFGCCSLVSKGYRKNTHDTLVLTNVHIKGHKLLKVVPQT